MSLNASTINRQLTPTLTRQPARSLAAQPPHTTSVPTVAEVDRIAAAREPVVRNLQITQAYHEIAQAMAARVGAGATWCVFATWASKQAGQTIRQEDMLHVAGVVASHGPHLVDWLPGAWRLWWRVGLPSVLGSGIPFFQLSTLRAALDRTSDAIARGNLKVFAEIGREFARFLAGCARDDTYHEERIDAFCSALKPGDAPEGQNLLRQAFRHYYQAMFETDDKVRTELLYLANLEIGYHEQTRLQPEIQEAMDVVQRMVTEIEETRHVWWRAFDRSRAALSAAAATAYRRALTEVIMSLDLPDGRIQLGADLAISYPPALQSLILPELRRLVTVIDPTPDSLSHSGAGDWANLGQRMHFIGEMFRAYHNDDRLLEAPFSQPQVAAIKAGYRPVGSL